MFSLQTFYNRRIHYIISIFFISCNFNTILHVLMKINTKSIEKLFITILDYLKFNVLYFFTLWLLVVRGIPAYIKDDIAFIFCFPYIYYNIYICISKG